jgi:hypothetical protein
MVRIAEDKFVRAAPIFAAIVTICGGCFGEPNYEGRDCGPNAPCPADFTCTAELLCTREPSESDAGELEMDAGETNTGPDAGEVGGIRLQTFATEVAEVDRGVDLSSIVVAAWVASDEAVPTFTEYPGSGARDGTYNIPGVPSGMYYLRFGSSYILTSARSPDLGFVTIGRSGGQIADVRPTQLIFSLSNLRPWQADDQFMAVVTTGNANDWGSENRMSNLPAVGTSVMTGAVLDWTTATSPQLIEGTAGDRLHLIQLVVGQSSTTQPFVSMQRIFSPSAFDMTNGSTTMLSGVATEIPLNKTMTMTARLEELDRYRTAIHPRATPRSPWTVRVTGQPRASTHGRITRQPSLLFNFNLDATTPSTIDLGTINYGNPFPSTWEEVGSITANYSVSYTVPGATAAVEEAVIYNYVAAAALPAAVQAPRISPVRNLKVNGADASTDADNIGLTPTLTWSDPAIGTPTGYIVLAHRLTVSAGATRISEAARFYLGGQTLHIPPDILRAGEYYFFRVIAVTRARGDFENAPFRLTLPSSYAETLSGMFRP